MLSGDITLVSSSENGVAGNNSSGEAAISADGRYAVFHSSSTNLITGISGAQVYRKDLSSGEITLVSSSEGGAAGDGVNGFPTISADGRYAVFTSSSTNLINGVSGFHIYRKDLLTDEITLVSSSQSGAAGNGFSLGTPSISADGRYAVFQSTSTNLIGGVSSGQIYSKDLLTGEITLVSSSASGATGNGTSQGARISADGRYAVFHSSSTNLITGISGAQVYRKNLSSGEITLVSSSESGATGNNSSTFASISADGRYVVFRSSATNLTDQGLAGTNMYIKDLATGKIFGLNLDGSLGVSAISPDGTYIMSSAGNNSPYAPATNGFSNAFVAYNPLIEQNSLSRLTWFDLKTQAGAQEALDWFKEYAREIERVGSTVGASLSRFNSATNTLGSMSENFRAAESRIVDADMAVLSAEAVRMSIIQQAATSVLAQANLQPSLVLTLLEGAQ